MLRFGRRATAALLLALGAIAASAHPTFDARWAELTKQLALDPDDSRLLLRRAELLREHGDRGGARADYRRAARLGAAAHECELGLGRLELEAGRPRVALAHFDRVLRGSFAEREFTTARAARPTALRQRALALAALGRHVEALLDWEEILAGPGRASPELYLQWAESAVAAGEVGRAIAGLDAARSRFGSMTSLDEQALEIELAAGRTDAALARTSRLIAESPRSELWALRRAEILERAGRRAAALEAYRAALREVAAVRSRRGPRAVARLRRQAELGISRTNERRP